MEILASKYLNYNTNSDVDEQDDLSVPAIDIDKAIEAIKLSVDEMADCKKKAGGSDTVVGDYKIYNACLKDKKSTIYYNSGKSYNKGADKSKDNSTRIRATVFVIGGVALLGVISYFIFRKKVAAK